MIEKAKSAYRAWMPVHRNMPRTERFGIGAKIDSLYLEVLETLRKAAYMILREKISVLETAISKIDSLRFFIQLAWETSLIPNNQYSTLGKDVEELGRMVGGWRRGLIAKTSAMNTEERRR